MTREYMQINTLIIIIFNLLFFTFPLGAQEVDNISIDNNLYFPDKFFIDTINPEADGTIQGNEFYERRKYAANYINFILSMEFSKLNEPKLYHEYPYEVYRFTWSAYLKNAHNPLTIRIENDGKKAYLIAKYIRYNRFSNKDKLIIKDTITIDKNKWVEFKNIINSINFWNISPIEKTSIVVFDGSTWILEGSIDKSYHMVHRKMAKHKEIGEVCLYLLKLSGIKVKENEFNP